MQWLPPKTPEQRTASYSTNRQDRETTGTAATSRAFCNSMGMCEVAVGLGRRHLPVAFVRRQEDELYLRTCWRIMVGGGFPRVCDDQQFAEVG